ncbi:FUSC family protein [Corynebacterium pacaense]|uniref:FUSC family protein n=1 Tax=Corynebacterium pacaense TaxID=1816684 RepID=UPI001FE3F178|nr:aromatic acid exporter family protein [Corynebacterium pacaense]
MTPAHGHAHRLRARIRTALHGSEFQISLIRIAKSVVAATAAWWISITLLTTDFPFLAPWTALLTIQVTALRTISHGVQTTVASILGITVTFIIGHTLGVSIWSYALALVIGLLLARLRWIRDEGIAVATTSIFILSDGFSEQSQQFGERMAEIAVGVGIGIAVELLFFPPMRDRQANAYIDSVTSGFGQVLTSIGETVSTTWDAERSRDWLRRIDAIDVELTSAWSIVRFARESRRANPRAYPGLRFPRRRAGDADLEDQPGWENILGLSTDAVAHLKTMTRVLHDTSESGMIWGDDFRRRWSGIAMDTGAALSSPDSGIDADALLLRLDQLAAELPGNHNPDTGQWTGYWPVYGSLITGLRHIITLTSELARGTGTGRRA